MTAPVDRALLAAALAGTLDVVVHEETGSTNDDAKALAKALAAPTLVVAEAQRAGRGRSGSRWHSPPGENLYASLLLRPAIAPERLPPLSLAVGCALLEVVDRHVAGARIKWPNDVWIGGRKLAGILVEAQIVGDRVAAVIVGVGLNVGASSFPPELDRIATSLAREGASSLDRTALLAELARSVVAWVQRYALHGLTPALPMLEVRDALRGRRVRVGELEGRADGVDSQGRLKVRLDAGSVEPVVAGHVELLTTD